ncbi:MAG: serine/threonine-protein kinase [Acidobacteriota bacterium]
MSFLDRWSEVDRLFDEALDRPPGERAAFVESACRGDEPLRRHLDRLVRLAGTEHKTLDAGAVALVDSERPSGGDRWVGRRVGPYRLRRELGSGGMGTVYLATRDDGLFEHEVALKLVRPDLSTETVLRRFHHERRILASLQHPLIARLYDGGTIEDTSGDDIPYLVMEFVDGEPITEYCACRNLSVDAVLELFGRVCDAVQAAHQALVVHRDLKPSNLLVDRHGEPKLLDFGIAKLLDDDAVSLTGQGIRPMTPAYASPEQIQGDPVTTATDVYALGAMLYTLLADRPPHGLEGGVLDLVRSILQDRPPAASTVAPRERRRQLRGDLDAILAKALAQRPGDRYATARELAEDLRRHRARRPVRARPPTVRYRAAKLVARHAAAFGAILLAGLVLAALLVWHTVRLAAERDHATRQAAKAEAVQSFVVDLFGLADPNVQLGGASGDALSALDLLDAGQRRLDALDDQPAVQSELQIALAVLYSELGRDDHAAALLEASVATRRAEDASFDELAEALYELGVVRRLEGELEAAEALHREALALRRQGPADASALAESTNELGIVAWARGDYEAAEAMHRETLERRRALAAQGTIDRLPVSSSLNNLALALSYQGRPAQALPLLEESLAIRRVQLGARHTRIVTVLNNMARVFNGLGRLADAERTYREALEMSRELYGTEHRQTARLLLNLSVPIADQGRFGEALELAEESLRLRRMLLDLDHPDTLSTQGRVAGYLHRRAGLGRRDDLERAESLLRDTLERRRARGDAEHPDQLHDLGALGEVLLDAGRLDEAEALLREVLKRTRGALGVDHPSVAWNLRQLGDVLRCLGREDEARQSYRDGLALLRRVTPESPRSETLRQRLETAGRPCPPAATSVEVLNRPI